MAERVIEDSLERITLALPLGGMNDDFPSDLIGERESSGERNMLADNGCCESRDGSAYMTGCSLKDTPCGGMWKIEGDRGQKFSLYWSSSSGKFYRIDTAGTHSVLKDPAGTDLVFDVTLPPNVVQVKAGVAYLGNSQNGWYKFTGSVKTEKRDMGFDSANPKKGIPRGYLACAYKGRMLIVPDEAPYRIVYSKVNDYETFPMDDSDGEEPFPHILDVHPHRGAATTLAAFDNYVIMGKISSKHFIFGSLDEANVSIVEADPYIGMQSPRSIALHGDGLLYLSSLNWFRAVEQAGIGQGRSPEYGSRRWDCGKRLRKTMINCSIPNLEHRAWMVEKKADFDEGTYSDVYYNTDTGALNLTATISGYFLTSTATVYVDDIMWKSGVPTDWYIHGNSFRLSQSYIISSLGFMYLWEDAITSSITLNHAIFEDDGTGRPKSAPLIGQDVTGTTISTTYTWLDADFGTGVLLNAGRTYYVVASIAGILLQPNSYMNIGCNANNPYADGIRLYDHSKSSPPRKFTSIAWNAGSDLCFRLKGKTYAAVGTWTAPVRFCGSDIGYTKPWVSPFPPNALNAGTLTFQVRSSAAEFTSTAVTPAWTTVTDTTALNTLIPTTDGWRQMRSVLTYGGSGLTTPDLKRMGFGWVSGDLTSQWVGAASFQGRAYFTLKSGSSYLGFVYDRNGGWHVWDGAGMQVTSLLEFNGQLLGGLATTSTTTTAIIVIGTGTTDYDGSAISWYLQWRDTHLGIPEKDKIFTRQILTAKSKGVTLTGTAVTLARRIDLGNWVDYQGDYLLGTASIRPNKLWRSAVRGESVPGQNKYDRGIWIAHKIAGTKPTEIHGLQLQVQVSSAEISGGDDRSIGTAEELN